MKKIMVLIFLLFLIGLGIFFWLKNRKKNKDENANFISNFKSSSVMKIGEKSYNCDFLNTNGNTEISIQGPENIKGLKLSWQNGKQFISFNDISKEFKQESVPKESFVNLLVKIVNMINNIPTSKKSSDGKYTTWIGKIEKYDFEITSDEKGNIKDLLIPSKNSKITFNDTNAI